MIGKKGMLWFLGPKGAAGIADAVKFFVSKHGRQPVGLIVAPGSGLAYEGLPVFEADWMQKGCILLEF